MDGGLFTAEPQRAQSKRRGFITDSQRNKQDVQDSQDNISQKAIFLT